MAHVRQSPSGPVVTDITPSDIIPGVIGQVFESLPSGLSGWNTRAHLPTPWGDGSNGDLVVAPGTVLGPNMLYDTVSFAAGGTLNLLGSILRCLTLDLSGAGAGAIFSNGGPGIIGVAGVGGAGGIPNGVNVTNDVCSGADGGAGGNAGAAAANGAAVCFGYSGSDLGNGQNGADGGANVNAFGTGTVLVFKRYNTLPCNYLEVNALGAVGLPGGGGGGGGGGSSAVSAGGGGGAGGSAVVIYAQNIITNVATAAGAIQALGGAGGDGETTAVPAAAGGSGGGGGSGGWVVVAYQSVTGVATPNLISATGAAGGDGGDGGAGGAGGAGGDGGPGGRILLFDCQIGSFSETTGAAGAAGAAPVGAVGGLGGAGGVANATIPLTL